MVKVKLLIGFAVIVSIFLACAPSAFAEFKAQSKGSEGHGALNSMQLTDSGTILECSSNLESKSASTWTIEKSKEHVEKGPSLLVKLNAWGKCLAEVAGLEAIEAKGSACEIEAKEPKTEEKVLGTFVSNCSVRAELGGLPCEMIIEPTGNKELKEVSLAHSGGKDENLILEFSVTGVTVTAKGAACEAVGIKTNKEGKLVLISEAEQVAPETLVDEFQLARTGGGLSLRPTGTTRSVIVKFTGTNVTIPNALLVTGEVLGPVRRNKTPPFFRVENNPPLTCQMMPYGLNDTCEMKIKSLQVTANIEGLAFYWFKILFNGRHAETFLVA
jgi:hypothetical protein